MGKISTDQSLKKFLQLLLSVEIIEGLLSLTFLLLIPNDSKNAFLFGYSKDRLLVFCLALIFLLLPLISLFNVEKVIRVMKKAFQSQRVIHIIKIVGVLFGLVLWFTIWFPAARFGLFAAAFIRLKPVLLWVELSIFQFYIFTKLSLHELDFHFTGLTFKNSNLLPMVSILALLCLGLFELLKVVSHPIAANTLLFPPSAPISSLQLFLCWISFIGIFFLEQHNLFTRSTRSLILITFIAIWFITVLAWSLAPLTCTDDRPGPYPPNNQCYTSVNDAVYTIGSHYITLGEGIYNHWQTDKPLYLVFLAFGEWVFGPRIDRYLLFQIIALALIPALLFLLGRKFIGYSGGLLLAGLSAILGYNEIVSYQVVGGVNAKLENTELFTALFLIILCIFAFKWWSRSNTMAWAVMTGGTLGLASLIRMNPIFILPIFLIAYSLFGRKNKKSMAIELGVFFLAFLLTFLPGILAAQDINGKNFYLAKIQDVISARYFIEGTGAVNQQEKNAPGEQATLIATATQAVDLAPSANTENKFSYPPVEITETGYSSIITHFINNEFTSLAILPTTFTFLKISDQEKQPIWDFQNPQPIWNINLSLENSIVLLVNFVVVLIGLSVAVKRYKLAGASAFLIQIGYHMGNAFAKTSGGRYLQPVNWVTLFYFVLGLVAVSKFVLAMFTPKFKQIEIQTIEQPLSPGNSARLDRKAIVLLTICLVAGLVIPILNHIPSSLPEEMNSSALALAENQLKGNHSLTEEQWKTFLASPNHLVVEGRAYDPIYYRSNFYQSGDPSFEMMVLGKDHVVVSYLLNVAPEDTFTDGSDTVLIGCKIGQDNLWSADRIIVRTLAEIQKDHEKSVLVDPKADWSCLNY